MATIDPTKLSIKFNNVTYTTSDPVNKLTVTGNDFTFEITVPNTGDYDVEPTYDGVRYNTQAGTDVKVLGSTTPPVTETDNDETLTGVLNTTLTANLIDNPAFNDVVSVTIGGITKDFTAGDSISFTDTSGTFTITNTGSFTFVPTTDYTGTVPEVSYTVSGLTGPDTSSLTISAATEPLPTKNYNVAFGHYMEFAIGDADGGKTDQPLLNLYQTGMAFNYNGVDKELLFTIKSTDTPALTAYTNLSNRVRTALVAAGLTDIQVSLSEPQTWNHPQDGSLFTGYYIIMYSPTNTFDSSKGYWVHDYTKPVPSDFSGFTRVKTYDLV